MIRVKVLKALNAVRMLSRGKLMNYFVYIMTNFHNTVLYIGVTNDLRRRVWEHKNGIFEGFTKRYHLTKLVYYEVYPYVINAIAREKQLKAFRREKKNKLIYEFNPTWSDLSEKL